MSPEDIQLTLNGEPITVGADATVQTLVELLIPSTQTKGLAVAVDSEVVPHSQWAEHRVKTGTHVEILRAIQGG